MIKKALIGVFLWQLSLTAVLAGLLCLDSVQNIGPLLIGSVISSLNFTTLVVFYVFVFQKKSVALGIFIVVIKYAILGFLLWYFLVKSTLPQGAFLTGIIVNPAAVVVFALLNAKAIISKS